MVDISDLPAMPDSVIVLDSPVQPAILASILGINVSLVYQEVQKGRLPQNITTKTYRHCIQYYLNYFKKAQDIKLDKHKKEQERAEEILQRKEESKRKQLAMQEELERKRELGKEFANSIHPLVAQKLKQEIRLNVAREAQLWQKIAIERKTYISLDEMQLLCEPFVTQIKDSLVTIGLYSDQAEADVAEIFNNIDKLARALLTAAEQDEEEFIDRKLTEEIVDEEDE